MTELLCFPEVPTQEAILSKKKTLEHFIFDKLFTRSFPIFLKKTRKTGVHSFICV